MSAAPHVGGLDCADALGETNAWHTPSEKLVSEALFVLGSVLYLKISKAQSDVGALLPQRLWLWAG